jgi:hypothetical protein
MYQHSLVDGGWLLILRVWSWMSTMMMDETMK